MKEVSCLLLFVLTYLKSDSKTKLTEANFKKFLHVFNQNDIPLRTALFQLPPETRQLFQTAYLRSEVLRMKSLKIINQRLELTELFTSSLDFMEETLKVYHRSHYYFLDCREAAAAKLQFTDQIRRSSITKPTCRESSSTIIEPRIVVDVASRAASSEPYKRVYTFDETLHLAGKMTTNKQARAALFNATTLLDDLFIELESVSIRSHEQRIEHLDYLLVNLSLFFEQMISFKVLERINPKSREAARPYLIHNLLSLSQALPEEMRAETEALAVNLNGVENCSRFFTKQSSSENRAIRYLSILHSPSEDTESSSSSAEAIRKEIYLFVKEELERIFEILLQKDIRTEAWEKRWEQIVTSKMPASSQPSPSSSSTCEDAQTYSSEVQSIFDTIERLIATSKSLFHSSVWVANAQRLLAQLKARVSLAENISDLSAAHKRTAGLMSLIAWSICIATAEKKRLIAADQTHPSNLSKNLWTWVVLILGDEKADEMTLGEKRFCDLSRSIYFQNRYQHNSKKTDFPLWRIGCSSREEELAFISSSSANRDLVTLRDGLRFIERILAN